MTAIWWSCCGSSEQLVELAPCDVLAETPEIAAIEYATDAHSELEPDATRIVVDVHAVPCDLVEAASAGWAIDELAAREHLLVTSERGFVGRAEPWSSEGLRRRR